MKTVKSRCRCTVKGAKEYKRIDEIENFLQVLSDRTRLRILCLIKNEELNVKSIYEEIGIKQTLASHHIAQLKKMGLLKERKEGTSSFYRVDSKKFEKYCGLLGEIIELDLKNDKCC